MVTHCILRLHLLSFPASLFIVSFKHFVVVVVVVVVINIVVVVVVVVVEDCQSELVKVVIE